MLTLFAAAAAAVAQPAAPMNMQAQMPMQGQMPMMQMGQAGDHKAMMDCCKDCCKDMAKSEAAHAGHKDR